MELPDCQTLNLTLRGGRLDILMNRPEQRNAINAQMAAELIDILNRLHATRDVRLVVLRGAGGNFCAGGDIKERRAVAEAAMPGTDPVRERNERAGRMFRALQTLPQTTIAAVEGSAFGGGLGFACCADLTIVTEGARMGMPEVTLGIAPAQIAPFVVKRVGLSRACQLALTASRFDGRKAYEFGIAQYLCADDGMDLKIEEVAAQVIRCAPMASAATKEIMLAVGRVPEEDMPAFAAQRFAALADGVEGREGQLAFVEKRPPVWAADPTQSGSGQ